MLGSIMILGMAIGALFGGMVMKIGRRKVMIATCFLGMLGALLTFRLNFEQMLVGKFVYGLAVGIHNCIAPRYIEETIP